jgi:hypothetical protein
MDDRDLPEGVIDADPPGGWEDAADAADTEDAEPTAPPEPPESDAMSRGADPDLSADAQD